jgi:hypothetical protein
MVEIKYKNIPMFIGKMLLTILITPFTIFIFGGRIESVTMLIEFTMSIIYIWRHILIITFPIYFIFNLSILVILYTRKIINILKNVDIILFILSSILLICYFIIAFNNDDAGSHGALFFIPIVSDVIYFSLAFIIDLFIIKRIKNE